MQDITPIRHAAEHRPTARPTFRIVSMLLACCFPMLSVAGDSLGGEIVELHQEDFRYGTYIIDRPGRYRLAEDITFNPNSAETLTQAIADGVISPPVAASLDLPLPPESVDAYRASSPLFTQFADESGGPFTPGGPLDARYDPRGFGLGFFAAIVIAADGVELNLNGHTIEQSEEHALLQRFFAVIELAEQPFVPNQGPADFGSDIIAARNVVIRNGTIGRSSHHGIHGNGNQNIVIANVDFVDYEVGAVALNGVDGLIIRNSNATNRKDVPILGTFSSARFIKPYVDWLVHTGSPTTLDVQGTSLSAADIQASLRTSINRVHEDIILDGHTVDGRAQIDASEHPAEYALFHNPFGVVDGNSYSFLVNKLGVAVNGFPTRPASNGARNVFLINTHVDGQHAFINEIVALNQGNKAVIDPVGAVFQILNTHPDTGAPVTMTSLDATSAEYSGNAIANAQALVAKAALAGAFDGSPLDISRLNITAEVLDWVEAQPGHEYLSSIAPDPQDFFCNGDSMFHVNKGVIAFKMDAANRVILRNTSATDIVNLGRAGSDRCGDYSGARSHPDATLPGYGGARTRAYTFSGSSQVLMLRANADALTAAEGSATGVDVMTDSRRIRVFNADVSNVRAGLDGPAWYDGPNDDPVATGFRVGEDARRVTMLGVCAELLAGLDGEASVDDLSALARIVEACD